MTKEQIIEEIKLNVVDIIFNREAGWSDKLEKIIDLWVSKAISQTKKETREETIKEILKLIREYIKENEKLGYGNRVIIADELYAKISILKDILNKLKN